MSKTKTDLVNATLRKLGALAVGQTPSADDTADVEERLTGLLEELGRRNVYYFGDADDIPEEAFNYLVTLLAQVSAENYGSQPDGQTIEFAEGRLRVLSRIGKGKGEPLTVDRAVQRRRPLGTYRW